MTNYLYVTNLTSDPVSMLYHNYTEAAAEILAKGETPCMSFEQFIEYIDELAEQTPLTQALSFVDNLLVNFDYQEFLFG